MVIDVQYIGLQIVHSLFCWKVIRECCESCRVYTP